nr:hypothetical protein [Saccharibacter sp. 17.LH.SD]
MDAYRWRPASVKNRAGSIIRLYPIETGSCEGCAMEISALNGSTIPLEGSGFQIVKAPEEADWLLVTGAVTRSRIGALAEAWNAMPQRKSLVAIGACAQNGGPFKADYATLGGVEGLIQVYRSIPGCPPSPHEIFQALLALAEG